MFASFSEFSKKRPIYFMIFYLYFFCNFGSVTYVAVGYVTACRGCAYFDTPSTVIPGLKKLPPDAERQQILVGLADLARAFAQLAEAAPHGVAYHAEVALQDDGILRPQRDAVLAEVEQQPLVVALQSVLRHLQRSNLLPISLLGRLRVGLSPCRPAAGRWHTPLCGCAAPSGGTLEGDFFLLCCAMLCFVYFGT